MTRTTEILLTCSLHWARLWSVLGSPSTLTTPSDVHHGR
jgi:hypothetical protein